MLSLLRVILLMIASLAAAVYLAVCLAVRLYQTRLIFFPSPHITTTPADLGLPYETVRLPIAETGEWVQGWWIPSDRPHSLTVLQLHGNSHNIGANVHQAARLRTLGLSVFSIDYRGYGESRGRFPNEARVYDDADLAWHYLTQQRHIPEQNILLYGHSLGGAIAIELASRHPNLAGLIIQSSFTSMGEMVSHATLFDRFLPMQLILTQHFDSLSKVRSLRPPVLYIHGKDDPTIPYQCSEALQAATASPSQIVLIPHADHNNVGDVAGDRYLDILEHWLNSLALHPAET